MINEFEFPRRNLSGSSESSNAVFGHSSALKIQISTALTLVTADIRFSSSKAFAVTF